MMNQTSVSFFLYTVFLEDNYLLYEAGDGIEALSLLKRNKVDAALVDLQMPEMDGLGLLGELKKTYPEITAIMLTGQGGSDDAVKAIKLGAVDFLQKPFPSEELHFRVDQLYRFWLL